MISSRSTARRRCVLVFFGIDRRLDITGPSITEKVLAAASADFDVSSTGFLWSPKRIVNPRSGEDGPLPPPRLDCLPPGEYQCAAPPAISDMPLYQRLVAHGDYWNDGFKSLSNVIFQLQSLHRATEMALSDDGDVAIFLRPDLLYHDSFAPALARHAAIEGPIALLPHWQPHGGLNDRFAICFGRPAIRAYGLRISKALEFCQANAHPMHSEKLVRYAMDTAQIPVRRVTLRASRVRFDGNVWPEDFSFRGWKPAVRAAAGKLRRGLWSAGTVRHR